MKRIINYWREFFVDLKIWRKYRKIVRADQELLQQNRMRVDWLGRVYTIINMPEEVINNQEMIQQGWVIQQLGPLNEILMKLGVNDYAYPEISKVPNSNSYLIVMYPEIDTLNPWRMLWNLLGLGLLTFLIAIAYNLILASGVIGYVKSLF